METILYNYFEFGSVVQEKVELKGFILFLSNFGSGHCALKRISKLMIIAILRIASSLIWTYD